MFGPRLHTRNGEWRRFRTKVLADHLTYVNNLADLAPTNSIRKGLAMP